MPEKKKKITIESLAAMVQKGFAGAEENAENRFNGIDARLDNVDSRLNKLEKSQKQILERLEGVDKERVDGIDERVKNIEDLFAVPAKK